jgi:hypothetical protein
MMRVFSASDLAVLDALGIRSPDAADATAFMI